MNTGSRNISGLTLIEMAIVLVIISFIIAGILGANSLIHNARLSGIITDLQEFQTAYDQFTDKYRGPPGDLLDASLQWTGVGNGNGNWRIDTEAESFLAWQHLGLADMIRGDYTGVSSYPPVFGTNLPHGRFDGTGYALAFMNMGTPTGNANWTGVNAVMFGGSVSPSSYGITRSMLSPSDTISIDKKMDDGMPHTGIILGWRGETVPITAGRGCVEALGYNTSPYLLSNTANKDCLLINLLAKEKPNA